MEDVRMPSTISGTRLLSLSAALSSSKTENRKTGAARLLEIKQDMFDLQEKFDEEKLAYARKVAARASSLKLQHQYKENALLREQVHKQKEEELRRRDAALEESLVRFSKYLQENDAKRARALKKAADERRLCEEKAAEAQELIKAADSAKEELAEAQDIVTRNMRHQEYLESVIEHRASFQEIGDLISRHSTLALTNKDLRQQQQKAARQTEQIRLETQAYAKSLAVEILSASVAIPKLKKEIEAAQQASAALEEQRQSAAARAAQQALERGQNIRLVWKILDNSSSPGAVIPKVVMATRHLYQRCLEHSRVAHSSQAHLAAQLKAIGNFVADYQAILRSQQH